MARPHDLRRKLLLAAASLAAALLAAELTLRARLGHPLDDVTRDRVGWGAHGFVADPQLEYAFEPGLTSRMTLAGEYDVPFSINAQGLRDEVVHAPSHPGRTRILLLGDSYVFGVGVHFEETIGERLEARLDGDPVWDRPTEVVAVGCPSYALDSYAKLAERWVPRLRPDLVLVMIFPGNDMLDYAVKAADPRAVVDGYVVSRRQAWSYRLRRVSALAHLLLERFNPHDRARAHRPGDPTIPELLAIYESTAPWCERLLAATEGRGVPLAITLAHGRRSVQAWREGQIGFSVRPVGAVLQRMRETGVRVLDPRAAMQEAEGPLERYYHPTDGHFSPAGCALVADAIAERIVETFADVLPRP